METNSDPADFTHPTTLSMSQRIKATSSSTNATLLLVLNHTLMPTL